MWLFLNRVEPLSVIDWADAGLEGWSLISEGQGWGLLWVGPRVFLWDCF